MYDRDPYTFANHDALPPHIRDTISLVMKSWDQPVTDYVYAEHFVPGGILHIIPEPAIGDAAIRGLHDTMVNPTTGPIVKCQHYFDRMFLMPGAAGGRNEVVFNGTLTNRLKNGEEIVMPFATWVLYQEPVEGKGDIKFERVKGYAETTPLLNAIAQLMGAPSGA